MDDCLQKCEFAGCYYVFVVYLILNVYFVCQKILTQQIDKKIFFKA